LRGHKFTYLLTYLLTIHTGAVSDCMYVTQSLPQKGQSPPDPYIFTVTYRLFFQKLPSPKLPAQEKARKHDSARNASTFPCQKTRRVRWDVI